MFSQPSWVTRARAGKHSHSPNILPDSQSELKPSLSLRRLTHTRWVKNTVYVACMILFCVWLSLVTMTTAGSGSTTTDTMIVTTWEQGSEQVSGSDQVPSRARVRVTQLTELNPQLLPGNILHGADERTRRLIFIGDIHGCYQELMALLAKANYDERCDHIVATGDIVNKGPNSEAVIDFLLAKGASCVRGNHDDKILQKAAQARLSSIPMTMTDDPESNLAARLTDAQIDYLESCPIILRIGELPPHGNIVVVHGGLVPSAELEDQDPWTVMNLRILHHLTHVASKEHDLDEYIPWASMWNQEQERHVDASITPEEGAKVMLASHFGTTVIYGHDAKSGLRIQHYTKGLDSGCVRGRKLTALVLSDKLDEEIVQVECARYT